ncbi:MAG: GYF domain-containing protein [Verrucomicrobiales bacterium]
MDIHITRKGEKHGPYPEATARQFLEEGKLSPTDMAWHAGADGWKPLSEVLGAAQPPATPPSSPQGGLPKRQLAGSAPEEKKPADDEPGDPDKISVTRKGEAIGPYSRDKAKEYFTAGQLLPTDWGWHDGMDEWKPLWEVLGMEVPSGAGAVENFAGTGGVWSIGDCLSEGWQAFKGNLGGAIIFTLVGMIVLSIAGMLPLINLFLMGPLTAGMLLFFIKQGRKEPTSVGVLFFGLKQGYLQLLLLSILMFLMMLIAMLPGIIVTIVSAAPLIKEINDFVGLLKSGNITSVDQISSAFEDIVSGLKLAGVGGMIGVLLIGLIPPILLTYTCFAFPLAIDRQMKAIDAIKASFQIVKGQWFKLTVFLILVQIISQLGMVLCGIGVLFTMPIGLSAMAACYLRNVK